MFDYDICVIGAGSAGVRVARLAANHGATVAIVEQDRFGGTCVNVGCIPKKYFVIASEFAENFRLSQSFGWSKTEPTFNIQTLIQAKDEEIARLNRIYQTLLDNADVSIFTGSASFIDTHTIQVGDNTLSAHKIIIATGCYPSVPKNIRNSELAIVSDDIFLIDSLPSSMVIYGGGYIAVEFACLFNALGVDTHLIYRGTQLLRHFDQQVTRWTQQQFEKHGLNIHLQTTLQALDKTATAIRASLKTHDNTTTIDTEMVLLATGRSANTQGLNLKAAGIKTNKQGFIDVDTSYKTTADSVYALGDITGGVQLTPKATAEAMDFVRQHINPQLPYTMPKHIATAIFCQPTISSVGLTEEQARQNYDDIAIYTSEFTPLPHSLCKHNKDNMFMKIIVDGTSDLVLGIYVVGHGASEIVQGFAAAMEAGITKTQLDTTLGIHPTVAEELVTMYQADT